MIINLLISSLVLWALFIIFATVKKKYLRTDNMFFEGLLAVVSVPFFIVDVIFNLFYGSIVFLQMPHYKRLTLTERLKFILENGTGWRYSLASFICRRMIEPWEQGHCSLD